MPKQLLVLTDAYGVEFACFADSFRILPGTGGMLEIRYNGQVTGLMEPWEYIGDIAAYDWGYGEAGDDEMDCEPDSLQLDTEWVN